LIGKGEAAAVRSVLEKALRSARAIGTPRIRDSHVEGITRARAETGHTAR
jgi:hypothetical protein